MLQSWSHRCRIIWFTFQIFWILITVDSVINYYKCTRVVKKLIFSQKSLSLCASHAYFLLSFVRENNKIILVFYNSNLLHGFAGHRGFGHGGAMLRWIIIVHLPHEQWTEIFHRKNKNCSFDVLFKFIMKNMKQPRILTKKKIPSRRQPL